MADTQPVNFETHRSRLAYFWSIFSAVALGYIIVRWGDRVEILTLIIGLIGGTILGGIYSVYFVLNNKSTTVNQTADKMTNTPVVGEDKKPDDKDVQQSGLTNVT